MFVGRDIIGDGDRELGANLMRMFFYTLAQGEDKPGAVLFMNAGVRLPTLDEQIPAHLKALADAGVEILVCGTCLSFYGLTDQLQVGTVSNMYDIVTRMQRAAEVVSLLMDCRRDHLHLHLRGHLRPEGAATGGGCAHHAGAAGYLPWAAASPCACGRRTGRRCAPPWPPPPCGRTSTPFTVIGRGAAGPAGRAGPPLEAARGRPALRRRSSR